MALAGTLHNLASARRGERVARIELATWRGAEAIGLGKDGRRLVPGGAPDVVVIVPAASR
jgi:hypothetical protein